MYDISATVARIKRIAKEQGKSITDMLSSIGLNKNTLSSMSNRGSWIASDSLAKIADYLGVSVDYLLGRETEQPAPLSSKRSELNSILSQMDESELEEMLRYGTYLIEKKR